MSVTMSSNPLDNVNDERPILTPEFVADYLNISYDKAKRLLRSRTIRGSVQVGREWRISPKRFIAYLLSIEPVEHGGEA